MESLVDILIIGAFDCSHVDGKIWNQDSYHRPACRYSSNWRADGLHSRSMEVFESFGFDEDVTRLWEPTTDWTLWWRGAKGDVCRKERVPSIMPLRTRWGAGVLQQGVIENIIERRIADHSSIAVEYEMEPTSLHIQEEEMDDPDAFPCVLRLRHKPCGKGETSCYQEEVLRAKYVIGADGAKSWTRKQLGFTMSGAKTRSVWGVMDLVVASNFPDIRTATTINSHAGGGLFFLRRERHLTRFYVQLNRGKEDEDLPLDSITQDIIVQKLQRLLRPYTARLNLVVKHCEWWSAYTIGHNLSSGMTKHNRVFLVGDAVHNHSPLLGLGMNVSMQDSYNLGWKLAGVVRKELNHRILSTFETERRPIAEELIATDRFHLQLFDEEKGAEPAWMLEREAQQAPFLAGLSVHYQDPFSTMPNAQQTEAELKGSDAVVPGKRFPQITVSNHATAKSYSIQSLLKADGRFHVVVFAGDISQPEALEQLNAFGADLRRMEESVLPASLKGFNVVVVHCAPRTAVELALLEDIFFPVHNMFGQDYDRVYCDMDPRFEAAGVCEENRIVLVRPDQYVAWSGGFANVEGLNVYLRRIFTR